MPEYPRLFSKFQVKSLQLKNRIVMSPMGSNFAQCDGQMSSEHIEYYRLRAAGGVGLIILENVCVDFPLGSNGTTQLRLDHDCFMPSLYRFNEVMHYYDCRTCVQINHAGATANPMRIGTTPVSASSQQIADGVSSRELNIDEIHDIVSKYGKAARRVKEAGFDAIEIHAGHGYLINQFLSPIWNQRADDFGSDTIENKTRFCRLVINAVREAVGDNFPIMLRMSCEEFSQSGNSLDDSIEILEYLQKDIDIIDASVGTFFAMDTAKMPDGWRSFISKAVKSKLALPCAVMGNIRNPKVAEEILRRGESDLIVIGRGLIADPEWANKVQYGNERQIRPCISCNIGCVQHRMELNRPIRCSVNPSIVREEWHKTHHIKKDCNVVVIGGGISGLEAACTAAETGCNTVLLEQGSQLGGWLYNVSKLPNKFRMKYLLNYMLNRANNLKNLTCLTNIHITKELIATFKPNIIICATGSEPLLPSSIQGLQEHIGKGFNIYDIKDFLDNIETEKNIVGKSIVIAGGGASALDVAEFFAGTNNVTIIEQLPEIGIGLDKFTKYHTKKYLAEHDTTFYTSHSLKTVNADYVTITNGNELHRVAFDYAFICLGLKPRMHSAAVQEFCEQNNIPLIYTGDSKAARRVYDCIMEGRNMIIEYLKLYGYYHCN